MNTEEKKHAAKTGIKEKAYLNPLFFT